MWYEKLGINKCGDCGGIYINWHNHFFGRYHLKWLSKHFPVAYESIMEELRHGSSSQK